MIRASGWAGGSRGVRHVLDGEAAAEPDPRRDAVQEGETTTVRPIVPV
jgi:hypothetical protein